MLESFLNDLKIPEDFDGTAKLFEFYRSPTLSIFIRKPKQEINLEVKIIETPREDKQPAKDDNC